MGIELIKEIKAGLDSRPIRILHYVDENCLAWGETWIRLIKELNSQGTENHVVCKSGGTLAGRLKDEGLSFDTFDVPVSWLPWTGLKLGRIIDDFSPDILHTRLSAAARIGGYWGKRKGLTVVQTVDKYPKAYYHKDADFLIPCSESIKKHMLSLGFSGENMLVVPNSLDICRYKIDITVRDPLRRKLGISEEQTVILAAGRFVEWKGFDILLQAYAGIISSMPVISEKTSLLLIGDGEEKDKLTAMTRCLGIEEKVIMPGFVDDIRPYLWASDIFVIPSKTPEPFGIILIEAMAAGLVPVATKGGGPLDIIEDGVSGWLVEIGDKMAMAEKLGMLISDKNKWAQIAKEAVRRAGDFNVSKIAKETIEIYRNVLKKK